MIDLSASISMSFIPRPRNRRDDECVIVSTSQVAPTIIDFDLFLKRFRKFDTSVATYVSEPIRIMEKRAGFVSPINRSLNVITPILVGGKVTQPPIDDEIVYFDE